MQMPTIYGVLMYLFSKCPISDAMSTRARTGQNLVCKLKKYEILSNISQHRRQKLSFFVDIVAEHKFKPKRNETYETKQMKTKRFSKSKYMIIYLIMCKVNCIRTYVVQAQVNCQLQIYARAYYIVPVYNFKICLEFSNFYI